MTVIPPVEERNIRSCGSCANFRPDDEHWHSCVLDKGENRGPERHPEHLYHDRWDLKDSQLPEWKCNSHFTPEELQQIIDDHNETTTPPDLGYYKERVYVVRAGACCPHIDPDYEWTPENPVLKCSHEDNTDSDHDCSLDGRSIPHHCPLPVATRIQYEKSFWKEIEEHRESIDRINQVMSELEKQQRTRCRQKP